MLTVRRAGNLNEVFPFEMADFILIFIPFDVIPYRIFSGGFQNASETKIAFEAQVEALSAAVFNCDVNS